MKYVIGLVVVAAIAVAAWFFMTSKKVEEVVDRDKIEQGVADAKDKVNEILGRDNGVKLHEEGKQLTIENPRVKDIEGHIWTKLTGPLNTFTYRDDVWYVFSPTRTVLGRHNADIVTSCADQTPNDEGTAYIVNSYKSCIEFLKFEADIVAYTGVSDSVYAPEEYDGTLQRLTGEEALKYEAGLKAYLDAHPAQ